MKRIVFGITSLDFGGAERVLVDIVNKLVDDYEITIFTLYGKGEFIKQIDSRVKIVSLYKAKYEELGLLIKKKISLELLNSRLRKRLYDKYIAGKYDVEIAFLEGPITWLFSAPSNAKKIAWVHSDINRIFGDGRKSRMKTKLNDRVYQNYDKIVFVSWDILDKFKDVFKNNEVSKMVINNYIDTKIVVDKSMAEIDDMKDDMTSFVQVSRLVTAKAIPRLMDVCSDLLAKGYKFRMYIVGDGPLRNELKNKIIENNLSDNFILLGKRENPYPYMKKANYVLLSSLYEGYGMVVVESKILNKYIMITDTAAKEAFGEYKNGFIVDNSYDGIYEGLRRILDNNPQCIDGEEYSNLEIINNIKELIEGEL